MGPKLENVRQKAAKIARNRRFPVILTQNPTIASGKGGMTSNQKTFNVCKSPPYLISLDIFSLDTLDISPNILKTPILIVK